MSVPSHLFVGIVSTEKGRISSMQPKNCIAVSLFILVLCTDFIDKPNENRIGVSLFTIVLCTDFIDESNKNRIGVLFFRGQCWRITLTLSWGERCKSNAIGVAFEGSPNCL